MDLSKPGPLYDAIRNHLGIDRRFDDHAKGISGVIDTLVSHAQRLRDLEQDAGRRDEMSRRLEVLEGTVHGLRRRTNHQTAAKAAKEAPRAPKVWMIWVQGDDHTWLQVAWDDDATAENESGWKKEVYQARQLAASGEYEVRIQAVNVPGVHELFEIPEVEAKPA